MIKLERIEVMNMEGAIRGMRNPLNSWDKSDSRFNWETGEYIVGPNDISLARRLVKAGSDHRKFLRQIMVSIDITAPLYWWKDFDQYKVGTTTNSCSTMHKIHAKEFTKEDFSFENTADVCAWYIESTLNVLNTSRERFLETKDKKHWWNMIQFLPSSYNQLRTATMSYETLLNIYCARRHHKLDEWHVLCDLIERLPNFKEICLDGDNNE